MGELLDAHDKIDELQKQIETLQKKLHEAEAEIKELKACQLCGKPFIDNVPHINCADTVNSGANNQFPFYSSER